MKTVQDSAPALSDAQREWLQTNLEKQQARHAGIVADMEALSAQREEWIEQFLQRIQARGFNYNCDMLRTIPADEIPEQPDRPFKVVY
jgi:hypothetical protein